MPTLAADRSKRADVLQQLAAARFAFPSPEHPDWETVVNHPDPQMGVQLRRGGWIYPDLIVTEEPGHFIRMLAIVVLRHEVTEAEAMQRWLPLSKAGPCYIFVSAGQATAANRLCQSLGIKVAGIRTWRRTPAFGLEIVPAYSGPDLLVSVFSLLPPMLRPRAYRPSDRSSTGPTGAPPPPSAGGRCSLAPMPQRRRQSRPRSAPARCPTPPRPRPTPRPTTTACPRASTCRRPASSPSCSPLA